MRIEIDKIDLKNLKGITTEIKGDGSFDIPEEEVLNILDAFRLALKVSNEKQAEYRFQRALREFERCFKNQVQWVRYSKLHIPATC